MKNTTTKRLGAFLLITSVSGAAAYVAHAQSETASYDDWVLSLGEARQSLYQGDGNSSSQRAKSQEVYRLIGSAVGIQNRTAALSREWANDNKSLSNSNAFMVLQNQKLIEQNAEIIALLKARK